MNVSSSHLSAETLADLAEGLLEFEARETALAHISTCATCETALLQLRQLISMMRSDRGEDVPSEQLPGMN